jgi:hypothetical protein
MPLTDSNHRLRTLHAAPLRPTISVSSGVTDTIFEGGTRGALRGCAFISVGAAPVPVDATQPDFADLQVALMAHPWTWASNRAWCPLSGSASLRTIERIGPYNHVLDWCRHRHTATPFAALLPPCMATSSAGRWSRAVLPPWAVTIRNLPILKAVGRSGPVGT